MKQALVRGRLVFWAFCTALLSLCLLPACGRGPGAGSTASTQNGTGSSGGSQNSTQTTVSLAPSASLVASGSPVTFTVTATNANAVTITNNQNATSISVPAGGGSVTTPFPLTQTTAFTVTATGANDQQATAQVTVTVMSVSITASPTTIAVGGTSTVTVTATNASQVVVTDTDSQTYTLSATGGTLPSVSPSATTIYTATATNGGVTSTATVTVTVSQADQSQIKHVIFLMQENRTFDTYFGMLNPYRAKTIDATTQKAWNIGDDGNEYDVDGLEDPTGKMYTNFTNYDDEGDSIGLFKFATVCVDDMSSDWLASYGDVHKNAPWPVGFKVAMDGFVHTAEDYGKACIASNGKTCSGNITDMTGKRAMGYYDQGFLNYYYYMASQFAVSDRWFSPVSSKTIANRLATMTGGTTQGLVYDPFSDDNLSSQLAIPTIFSKLTNAGVSWKIYYGTTNGGCSETDGDCGGLTGLSLYPSITFADFTDSYKYLYVPATKGVCNNGNASIVSSGMDPAINDPSNSFCIDPTHIAPVTQWFIDVKNDTLPSFAFVEPAYGQNDEHPGSGQPILNGQQQVANMANALMATASNPGGTPWMDSVFFVTYDEGGGPFDHVPPVPNHTNDFTSATLGITTDISSIAVNPDPPPSNSGGSKYFPCPSPINSEGVQTPSLHCDLLNHGDYSDPGYLSSDAPAVEGFAAMLGFRLPNMVISPFSRRHFVSHVPMDHTAVLKFVEDRFIGDHNYLTQRDAAQPNLADPNTGFFDFIAIPWETPPTQTATPPPTPVASGPCSPSNM